MSMTTVIKPLEVRYPDFVEDYLLTMTNDYLVPQSLELCFKFEDLEIEPDIVPPFQGFGFEFYSDDTHLVIRVKENFLFDGATYALDYHNRMLFALAHDCACIASQESKNPVYARIFDNCATEIIMKQANPWMKWYSWVIAWRTEVAVRAWNSFDSE